MKAHAKLSASGSERWLNCPGSVALTASIPASDIPAPKEFADEGTKAHDCLEFMLKNRKNAKAIQTARKEWPEEMVMHATEAIQWVLKNANDNEILSETTVDLSFVREGMFGTTDIAIVELFGTLFVVDYKYGAGVVVEPKDNTQLIYYALGLAKKYEFNFQEVILVIIQPRAEHHDGPIRWHSMTIDELMAYEKIFRDGAEATDDPLAELVPGDWCRWCPAKAKCPSISDLALRQAQIDFAPERSDAVAVPEPRMLRLEELSNILSGAAKLETWIEAVREHAMRVLERGEHIPGFKLVKKRSIRKWRDVDSVTKYARKSFGDDAFEVKLLSPAQLEKTFKDSDPSGAEKFIKLHSTNESSGVTMVRESDPRPAHNAIEAEFTNLDEENERGKAKRITTKLSTTTKQLNKLNKGAKNGKPRKNAH